MKTLVQKKHLSDEQLEQCFHFFHKKHENIGDLDNARCPSDATHYKFIFDRNEEYQSILLYKYYKDLYPSKETCEEYTNLGFMLKHNDDFVVLHDVVKGYNDVHYQAKSTYNIKKFYKFLNQLRKNK